MEVKNKSKNMHVKKLEVFKANVLTRLFPADGQTNPRQPADISTKKGPTHPIKPLNLKVYTVQRPPGGIHSQQPQPTDCTEESEDEQQPSKRRKRIKKRRRNAFKRHIPEGTPTEDLAARVRTPACQRHKAPENLCLGDMSPETTPRGELLQACLHHEDIPSLEVMPSETKPHRDLLCTCLRPKNKSPETIPPKIMVPETTPHGDRLRACLAHKDECPENLSLEIMPSDTKHQGELCLRHKDESPENLSLEIMPEDTLIVLSPEIPPRDLVTNPIAGHPPSGSSPSTDPSLERIHSGSLIPSCLHPSTQPHPQIEHINSIGSSHNKIPQLTKNQRKKLRKKRGKLGNRLDQHPGSSEFVVDDLPAEPDEREQCEGDVREFGEAVWRVFSSDRLRSKTAISQTMQFAGLIKDLDNHSMPLPVLVLLNDIKKLLILYDFPRARGRLDELQEFTREFENISVFSTLAEYWMTDIATR